MTPNEYDAQKALVTMAIETILLGIGKPVHDEVMGRLFRDYNCHIPDCYDHPERLKDILRDIYGNSANTIVESIKKQLEGFEMQKGIDNFIAKISI